MSAPPTHFDPRRLKLLYAADAPGTLFAAALDGDTFYGAGTDGRLHALDLTTRKVTDRGPIHDNYVSSLAVRDGVLISTGYDRRVVWTELKTMKRLRAVEAHDGWVRKLALAPDGRRVVSAGDDMRVKVFDAATGAERASLTGHEARTPEGLLSALYAVAVSPDGRHAASGDRAGFVRVWDLEAGRLAVGFRAAEFYTFDAEKRARAIGGVRGLAFSPDGARLAVSGIGQVTNVDGFVGPLRVEAWDWRAGKRLAVGEAKHQAILNHVGYGPGRWLTAVGGGDGGGAIVCWDGIGVPVVLKPKGHLQGMAWSGGRLCAVGHGGFQVWGPDTERVS